MLDWTDPQIEHLHVIVVSLQSLVVVCITAVFREVGVEQRYRNRNGNRSHRCNYPRHRRSRGLFVCLSVFLFLSPDISKTAEAKITKLDTEI